MERKKKKGHMCSRRSIFPCEPLKKKPSQDYSHKLKRGDGHSSFQSSFDKRETRPDLTFSRLQKIRAPSSHRPERRCACLTHIRGVGRWGLVVCSDSVCENLRRMINEWATDSFYFSGDKTWNANDTYHPLLQKESWYYFTFLSLSFFYLFYPLIFGTWPRKEARNM